MNLRPRHYATVLGALALTLTTIAPATAVTSLATGTALGATTQATATVALPGPTPEAQDPARNAAVRGMTTPIYRIVARDGNTLLTPWESEARNAVNNLGWERYELAFYGSMKPLDNTVPVYRLYNTSTHSFLATASERETVSAQKYGFVNQGPYFYVPSWGMKGTDKVFRMHKVAGGKWRYQDVIGEDGVAAAQNAGWILDGHMYNAVRPAVTTPAPQPEPRPEPSQPPAVDVEQQPATPPAENGRDGDGEFTLVQINDTQHDVYPDTRKYFEARVDWILKNEEQHDIRFVTHTGDIVNYWESATNNAQYKLVHEVMAPLAASDIPFAATVGNHDSLAVGDGTGAANTDANGKWISYWGLRQTDLINEALPASYMRNMAGQMEDGKFDNSYHLFTAEGADFLVLSLELYPRQKAIDWAEGVVAAHPNHNVILLQHHWINSDGNVHTRAEYGEKAPSVVQKQIVDRYANVKMVLSGHTGTAKERVYTAPNGNQVLYSLANLSYDYYGPLRLFDIDVPGDTVKSQVIGAYDGSTGRYADTHKVDWIEK